MFLTESAGLLLHTSPDRSRGKRRGSIKGSNATGRKSSSLKNDVPPVVVSSRRRRGSIKNDLSGDNDGKRDQKQPRATSKKCKRRNSISAKQGDTGNLVIPRVKVETTMEVKEYLLKKLTAKQKQMHRARVKDWWQEIEAFDAWFSRHSKIQMTKAIISSQIPDLDGIRPWTAERYAITYMIDELMKRPRKPSYPLRVDIATLDKVIIAGMIVTSKLKQIAAVGVPDITLELCSDQWEAISEGISSEIEMSPPLCEETNCGPL